MVWLINEAKRLGWPADRVNRAIADGRLAEIEAKLLPRAKPTRPPSPRIVWLKEGDVTLEELVDLYVAARGRCVYCGVYVPAYLRPGNPAGFDHIEPRALGGKHTIANLQVCCKKCNILKRAQDPIDW